MFKQTITEKALKAEDQAVELVVINPLQNPERLSFFTAFSIEQLQTGEIFAEWAGYSPATIMAHYYEARQKEIYADTEARWSKNHGTSWKQDYKEQFGFFPEMETTYTVATREEAAAIIEADNRRRFADVSLCTEEEYWEAIEVTQVSDRGGEYNFSWLIMMGLLANGWAPMYGFTRVNGQKIFGHKVVNPNDRDTYLTQTALEKAMP